MGGESLSNIIKQMQQVAQKEVKRIYTTELGIVTEIFPHSDESDKDNYQCTVKLKNIKQDDGSDFLLKKVPVLTSYIGMACIPNVDDLVLLSFISGNINAPIITGSLYNDIDRPPVNNEKEFLIKQSNTEGGFIKIDAEGKIYLTSKNEENVLLLEDDTISISNEKQSIIVDFSGDKISITSDKDLELVASKGKILLDAKEIEIKSSSSMAIESGADAEIKSSAGMVIKGSTIDLN